MKVKLMAAVSAAVIGLTAAVAVPNKAEANWRGGWWVPGAVIGGIALGAAIASRPYYYGPGYYGYASGPYYYGGGSLYYRGGPFFWRRRRGAHRAGGWPGGCLKGGYQLF